MFMLNNMKKFVLKLKKLVPEPVVNIYHGICAFFAALKYNFPARKMFIVGVTGTKGKTSTSNYIWSVLSCGGFKTGMMTTANFRINDFEEINSLHMSMPSPFIIQKKLKEMLDKGVTVAVVEMTSEGMRQHRNAFIPVDVAVFTNLTPEHISSHGSFEAYKKAKTSLFKSFSHNVRTFSGTTIPRTIIANTDSEHADYYLSFSCDKKITFGLKSGEIRASDIESSPAKTNFKIKNDSFELSIPGIFNVYNALPAIIVGQIFSISTEKIFNGLNALRTIPGRMEIINEGQKFTVIVDFAHEAASMSSLLRSVKSFKKASSKIIVLSGAAGGGRERGPMTEVVARESDFLILTVEDAYESDPEELTKKILDIAVLQGKILDSNVFRITDRGEAIRKALSLAQTDDIVLITGKGGEQIMVTAEGSIPWNEREIVREETKKYAYR